MGKKKRDKKDAEAEAEQPGYESHQFKIYREDSASLDSQKLEVFKMYNGFLITMSTALLGGSVLVLKEFEDLHYHWILFTAWLLLVLTIITSFLELYFSQLAYERQMEIAGLQFASQDYTTQHVNCFSKICRFLLKTTTATFVCSLITILVFFSINLYSMRPAHARKEEPQSSVSRDSNPEKHPIGGNGSPDK